MRIVVVENVSFDGEYRRGMILLNARLAGKERRARCRLFGVSSGTCE